MRLCPRGAAGARRRASPMSGWSRPPRLISTGGTSTSRSSRRQRSVTRVRRSGLLDIERETIPSSPDPSRVAMGSTSASERPALLRLRLQHVLDGGDEVRRAGDDRLGVGAAGGDGFVVAALPRASGGLRARGVGAAGCGGFVVAALTGASGALSERVEVLVEGAGGHVALVEEVPCVQWVRA